MGEILRQDVPHCRSPHYISRKTYPVSKAVPSSAIGLVALIALPLCAAGIGADGSHTYPSMKGIAELTGLALQIDGKTPWAGARVELWWYGDAAEDSLPTAPDTGNSALWETTTDGRGAFAFGGLPPGRFWLRVSTQRPDTEYTASIERSLRVDIAPGDKAKAVEMVMDDLELRAQVFLYAGGPPVADANVIPFRVVHRRATGGGTSYAVAYRETNPVGRVAISNLEPGEYLIEAKTPGPAEGYGETGRTSVVIPEEGLAEPVIVLLQPHALRGTVRQADGAPGAGALVALGREVSRTVLAQPPETAPHVLVTDADAQGAFEFPHVGLGEDGRYWLYARGASGEERTQRVAYDWREPPQAEELKLTRCAIEGTLTRAADGQPVADVEIQQRQRDVAYQESWGLFRAVTDANGRFRFPGCDPGQYELTAEREHRPLAKATVATQAARPTEAALTIANTHVIGVAVEPDGKPITGAQVSVGGRHGTETDGQGSFELKDVLPGEQLLTISGAGGRYTRTVKVTVEAESPTRLRVVVPPFKPKLIVTVYKPSGEPAAGLQAHGYFHYDTGGAGAAGVGTGPRQLDAEGKCEFRVEGESRPCFMLMIPGVGCGEPEEVTVTGLEPEVLHAVRLRPAGSISGVVREEGTGRPAGGVMITPRQAAPAGEGAPPWNWIFSPPIGPSDRSVFPATGSRDGDGTFTIEPLPAATYELEVWDLFGHSHKVPVTLGPQQHLEGLEITVPHQEQAATVSGVILDSGGRPVRSREVALRVWHTWGASWEPVTPEFFEGIGKLRRVVTDEEGRFTLDPMPRGRWLIVPRDVMYTRSYGVVVSLETGPASGVTVKLPPEEGEH